MAKKKMTSEYGGKEKYSSHWKDGIKDTKVVFTPDNRGRFLVSWTPPKHLQIRRP